jgi:23S rRNA (adenine2030-N6)-methyltransferase
LNYRHGFHAGNFADVFKHVVVTLLIKALAAKDRPFCYLDTHAGAGRYDLAAEAARKTGEFEHGIARLWAQPPPALDDYLAAVRALNPDGRLRFYPGSPRLVRHLLRADDRMVLCELHPQEHAHLKREFAGDRQVAVHLQDGYLALKAFLPPVERRGLVLIDPPYEEPDELTRVAEALVAAYTRWSGGVYAVWYPIKTLPPVAALHRALRASGMRKLLMAELSPYAQDSALRMNGCGMVIANPPWHFDKTLEPLLPQLATLLRQDSVGSHRLEWLAME